MCMVDMLTGHLVMGKTCGQNTLSWGIHVDRTHCHMEERTPCHGADMRKGHIIMGAHVNSTPCHGADIKPGHIFMGQTCE
jgi:hypothetical protein